MDLLCRKLVLLKIIGFPILNVFNPHKRLTLRGTNLSLFIHIRTLRPFILSVAILLDVIFPKGENDGREKEYNPHPNKHKANLKQSSLIVKFNFLFHLVVKVFVEVGDSFFRLWRVSSKVKLIYFLERAALANLDTNKDGSNKE